MLRHLLIIDFEVRDVARELLILSRLELGEYEAESPGDDSSIDIPNKAALGIHSRSRIRAVGT